jgi:hypothetical protein
MQALCIKEKLDAVTAAAIAACDRDDGVSDGVIDDPSECVGSEGVRRPTVGDSAFTEEDANVVRKSGPVRRA